MGSGKLKDAMGHFDAHVAMATGLLGEASRLVHHGEEYAGQIALERARESIDRAVNYTIVLRDPTVNARYRDD